MIPRTGQGWEKSPIVQVEPSLWMAFEEINAVALAPDVVALLPSIKITTDRRGTALLRRGRQVGCIAYTNVAKDEIISRIQAQPALRPETIHGFCGFSLQDFQSTLSALVPALGGSVRGRRYPRRGLKRARGWLP